MYLWHQQHTKLDHSQEINLPVFTIKTKQCKMEDSVQFVKEKNAQ